MLVSFLTKDEQVKEIATRIVDVPMRGRAYVPDVFKDLLSASIEASFETAVAGGFGFHGWQGTSFSDWWPVFEPQWLIVERCAKLQKALSFFEYAPESRERF